jgi:transcription-repair coupling factor (superfamily II helicase)
MSDTFSHKNLIETLILLGFDREVEISQKFSFSLLGDSIKFWLPAWNLPHIATFWGDELESIRLFNSSEFKELELDEDIANVEQNSFEKIFQNNSPEYLQSCLSEAKNWTEFFIYLQLQIHAGEYAVHIDHGVAQYLGLSNPISANKPATYLLLQYDGSDQLYIPFSQIDRLTKYIGPEGVAPRITKLSSGEWHRILKKVKEDTAKIAKDLLLQMAMRENSNAPEIKKTDLIYSSISKSFPYILTSDQEKAIAEIERDLFNSATNLLVPSSARKSEDADANIHHKKVPMNRLLIGDVGFGKTEVALRTIARVIEAGFQCMLICPTTLLATQHYETFLTRFTNAPVNIALLSSFRTGRQNQQTLENLKEGKVDLVIGTHRLISDDVEFKNLGLIVVDEEQKFGVKQKEKLKALRFGVHVLSMSATPIPRTLSMALSKLQDISVITTCPPGRKSVITQLMPFDYAVVSQALQYEKDRGGQSYFVHNDIQTIQSIQHKLEELNPNLKFAVAYSHSKMEAEKLEETLLNFNHNIYDCLITTTIIENGLDIPNANTIFINKAERMGLSQLHQLRGRVGRSDRQAYCYIFHSVTNSDRKKKLDPEKQQSQTNSAQGEYFREEVYDLVYDDLEGEKLVQRKKNKHSTEDRLGAMLDYQYLGAGFQIANRDLELRGAGNILGKEQSGNINMVGYGMYMKMLEDEIDNLKRAGEKDLRYI